MPLVAAAAITAGGALLGANANKSAAKSAANASQQATDMATAEQRRQYDLSRQDQQPWLQTGTAALNQLGSLYGLQANNPGQGTFGTAQQGAAVPDGQAGNMAGFFASPDYQFRQQEQMRALTARNAALGIQDSGAAQRSALQLSGNLASGEFNNYANRLSALAGVGQTAANNNAQLGQNYAGQVGNLAMNNASNLASSYQAQGQANAGLYGSLAGIANGYIGQRWPVQ